MNKEETTTGGNIFDNREKLALSFKIQELSEINGKPNTPKITLHYWNQGEFKKVGSTEESQESKNPEFRNKINVEFIFETQQLFQLTVLKDSISKEKLGRCEFKLSSVICNSIKGFETEILDKEGKKVGNCIIKYRRIKGGSKVEYRVNLKAFEVKKVDLLDKSDPYLVIFRPANKFITEKDPKNIPSWVKVLETGYIKNEDNPNFEPFIIDQNSLCRGMENSAMKMEIWDYSEGEDSRLISTGYFSVYKNLVPNIPIETFDSEGKLAGIVQIQSFERRDLYSIVQHINNGLTLNLVAAIDFTASNGNPKNKSSLHYIDESGKMNQYQTAINKVFSVLEAYDTDKMIPVYGFGGMSPDLGYPSTSHMFPINGDKENPFAYATQGVLDLYLESLQKIRLSGPTYFAPCINETIQAVKPEFENGKYMYTTLLILTDGTICDIEDTFRAIEEAAKLPISIIIVGVGEEDYSQMNILDGDTELEGGKENDFKPCRDIVQFVPYRKFRNNPEGLCEEVLNEIPEQISYFYWMITNKEHGFD